MILQKEPLPQLAALVNNGSSPTAIQVVNDSRPVANFTWSTIYTDRGSRWSISGLDRDADYVFRVRMKSKLESQVKTKTRNTVRGQKRV